MREMKNSGIPWIREIPSHWLIARTKNVFSLGKDIVGEQSSNTQLLSLTTKGIKAVQIGSTSGKVPDSYDTYQVVHKDNLVFCLFDLDCSAVFSGVSEYEGMISPAYKVVSVNSGFLPRFYDYWYSYIFDGRKYMFLSKNIRYSLTYDDFAALGIVAPPVSEQKAIADFLDKKCAEIDEMITLQEKIIEELKAYKQSVITEAVTKGLNPDAPMKDSGVEWIGEIPEHWEARRIKFIGKAMNGLTYSPNDVCDKEDGVLVLRSSNIQNGKLSFEDNAYVYSCPDNLLVKKGDIIICSRNGSAALVGKSAIVENDIDACFGAFMMRFRSEQDSRYAYYMLTAAITQYRQLFSTTTINQLTLSVFANLEMPFISDKNEQKTIAAHLDKIITEIDSLISLKQSKIEQLKEYKKSIIYEYVTGKKEVEA